ncbi:penicillin acylase family protein [Cupriavidus basilensis]
MPGTGEWDWHGVLPFSTNPQVYNPRSGYIANWNNSPEQGYPASDLFALSLGRGGPQRRNPASHRGVRDARQRRCLARC